MNDSRHMGRVTRRTVEDQVYARIRQAILAGEIAAGERLVHDDLAERFGTSRIPVRDALKRLAMDGLVETDPRRARAWRVATFGRADIEEVYALRALLEARAAAFAAERISTEQLAALERDQAALVELAEAGDRERYVDTNQRFHSRIHEAAAQPRLARIIDGLWRGLPPLTPISAAESLVTAAAEHRAILDALAAHDAGAAATATRAHIDRARRELLAHVDGVGRLL